MLVTPNVALVVFATVLIASFVVAWRYRDYSNYDKCWFHTFIATLAGLGVFVTFMFYYNVVSLQAQQQNTAALEAINDLNTNLLNSVLKEINKAATLIPNFVLSITPLTSRMCPDAISPDPITPQNCTEKMTLSYRIFSLWQDILMTRLVLEIGASAYVTNFLQRANSPQLYQQWLVGKINFTDKTQIFGDLLFRYGLPITDQTPESYLAATNSLISDPAYQKLIDSC